MFLSKVVADRKRWDVVHDLEDRDRLHKRLMKFFMPELPGDGLGHLRQQLGILFRLENDTILLQSRVAPNGRQIPGYTFVGTKNVEKNYQRIQVGDHFRFRLEANTSVRVVEGDSSELWVPGEGGVETKVRTKRIGCGSFPARAKWLEQMARKWCFQPEKYSMDNLSPLRIHGGAMEVTRFEGDLKVLDRMVFLRCLQEGVGQGKSYGLGMLSIRNRVG